MAKTLHTIIQSNGDVVADFSGFVGEECLAEEERLRRELASLGLSLKTPQQQMHNRRASSVVDITIGLKGHKM